MNKTPENQERRHAILSLTGALLITVFAILVLWDGLNSVRYQMIGYDEGYNATVAANLARHGTYSVSYPFDIVFYNLISTGPMVILPTALLYKLFGISYLTSGIVPVVYMVLSIAVLWLLFCRCYDKKEAGKLTAAITTVVLILSSTQLLDASVHLLGETACLFFLLGACLFYAKGYQLKKSSFLFISGLLVMTSFLTKSTMIFFLVSLMGLVIIERLLGHISIGNALSFYAGLGLGFLVLELYKLFQLGNFSTWIEWWGYEWNNMLAQSGQIYEKPSISEKITELSSAFEMSKFAAVCIVLLPSILYLILFVLSIRKHDAQINTAVYSVIMWGVSGSSLEVFFVLFGGSGLIYDRRHAINVFFVKMVLLLCIGWLCLWGLTRFKTDRKHAMFAISLVLLLIAASFTPANVKTNAKLIVEKKCQDDYDKTLFRKYLTEIEELDRDTNLLCYDWWQEPDITLFLDRHMIDILRIDINSLDLEHSCFIVGRRFDDCTIETVEKEFDIKLKRINKTIVDYDRLESYGSHELFSIYSISR